MQDPPALPLEEKENVRDEFDKLAATVSHQFPTVPWVPAALALALYRREKALDSLKQKPSSAGDRERFLQVQGPYKQYNSFSQFPTIPTCRAVGLISRRCTWLPWRYSSISEAFCMDAHGSCAGTLC